VSGIAASTTDHAELDHKTAISTPTKVMPKVDGH
jgi:hypothetical protein